MRSRAPVALTQKIANARLVNRRRRLSAKNGSKYVAALCCKVHDTEVEVWLAIDMVVPCPKCGHLLWAELRSLGAFRFIVYFDDEVQSESYAEHVRSCPRCGVRLGGGLGKSSLRELEGVPWSTREVSPVKDKKP